jgi:copper resistance protein B
MMSTQINKTTWLLICAFALSPIAAQSADSTATTDHSTMDHSKMDMSTTNDSGAMDMNMDMPGMQMQGGSAPPDARDPNAYSDGQTLTSGDYVLPGPRLIHMADEHNFAGILVDRLERVDTSGPNSTAYDLMAWYGRDYNKLVIKSEGDVFSGTLEESRTDALWSHAITDYWDAQLGMRYDSSADLPGRSWLAAGVQGIAPYWFEIDATAYVGNDSRSALRLQAEYELLFTQKLILSPRIETNLYGKDDSARGIGSGVSDMTAGVRLRYEIRREFAPYIGVEYTSKYGKTADYARADGASVSDTHWVAGLRFWY